MSTSLYASAELYDPATGRFQPTGDMSQASTDNSGILLPDGRELIVGGDTSWEPSTIELYDPASGRFAAAGEMDSRIKCRATLLRSGKVLVTGGESTAITAPTDAKLYDPALPGLYPTGRMITPRLDSTATRLADGRVLIAGGDVPNADYSAFKILSSAELYDPVTGRFSATGHMAFPRTAHEAVLLPNGQVLIVGGRSS